MTINAAAIPGGYTDKVLWVIVRFFMLSTEMSVVIFGLAFGKFLKTVVLLGIILMLESFASYHLDIFLYISIYFFYFFKDIWTAEVASVMSF